MTTGFDPRFGHTEWVELCALAHTDALDENERKQLDQHLTECAECRELSAQYALVARKGMPVLAAEFGESGPDTESVSDFDLAGVKASVLAEAAGSRAPRHLSPVRKGRLMPAVGIGLAAAAILVAVAFAAYQKGRQSVQLALNHSADQPSELTGRLEHISAEKTALDAQLSAESQREALLEVKSLQAQSTIAQLQHQIDTVTASAQKADQANVNLSQQVQTLTANKSDLSAQLQQAQQDYQRVQAELVNLRSQRQQDSLHYASLETEVGALRRQLSDAEGRVNDDTQYLASDRDIRDLMGARQLYIADVTDVDSNGKARKPFGRVFYTKGKSLIFYAFDLDQQPGVKNVSTFQAWAREGSDRAHPVSLGIFYVDNEANRRWVLRTDDPKVLAQINSVFVTVEPKGGSQNPTGKPLLFAYLQSALPNHP